MTYELRRFRLVGVLRGGALASEVVRERKAHPERFNLVALMIPLVRGVRHGYTHLHRIGTTLHYRISHTRPVVAMELIEFQRLHWPDGAVVSDEPVSDRLRRRRDAGRTPTEILDEMMPGRWQAKQRKRRRGF